MNIKDAWYVVWSESRAEKKVAERLTTLGFAVWLPLITQRRRWSDRWKEVRVPLFPSYLFVCTYGAGYVDLLRTPGVRTLVKEGGRPATLGPDYVLRLQQVVSDPSVDVEPAPAASRYTPGDEVVVQEGPLAGLSGEVIEVRGARRLLVWVSGIGRGLLCTIGAAAVRPLMH